MALQPVCPSFQSPKTNYSRSCSFFQQTCSSSEFIRRSQICELTRATKSSVVCFSWWTSKKFQASRLAGIVCGSSSDLGEKPVSSRNDLGNVSARKRGGLETFRGKPGSISFYGLTHQMLEEGKLETSPFEQGTGSFQWVVAPVALILSLVLPPLFAGNIVNIMIKDVVLAEIVASLCSEVAFYMGLAAFLLITDRVQRPYLQFSVKRWGLITGLRGYLASSFFVMGLKIVAPLFAVYVTWPELGLEALVSVTPFLAGCLAQYAFEISLNNRGSACWPLVPIIFEIYRIYQLTKASHFIERLMFAMSGQQNTPQLMERSSALVGMLVTFQVLGIICLWSLITFLIRLFPSRPVAENY